MKPGGDRAALNDAGDDCVHRQPPQRPNVKDSGGSLELVFATHSLDTGYQSFDEAGAPRYQSIGFDLDDSCTSVGQPPRCIEPVWANRSPKDGPQGIDNAVGHIAWQQYPDHVDNTAPAALVRVRDYSGDPNDDQVEVALYYSPGLSSTSDGGPNPLWDGLDRWSVVPDSLLLPPDGGSPTVDQPRYVDSQAYVKDGILVARFDDMITAAPNSSLPVHARLVVMQAELRQVMQNIWELNRGVVGYRLALTDVLYHAAWGMASSAAASYYCLFPERYKLLGKDFCQLADVAYEGDNPSAVCNAVSTALGFDAKQALLGDVKDVSRTPACSTVYLGSLTCDSLGDP